MQTTDTLTRDVEGDVAVFKRHLNPLLRTLEETAERRQLAAAPLPPSPIFGDEGRRVTQSYLGLWLRPYAPTAWMEFWAAGAAFQFAALRALSS